MIQIPISFIPPLAFFNLGPWEIALIVFLALLFFGGKRLPSLAKDLGSGIKEFRKSLMGEPESDNRSLPRNEEVTEKEIPKTKKKKA
ncbi:Sec-independent protein secretion pathway translocase [Leptospira ryugenii]|uniref:Sec-independent protein translocase protein TatA n=1 Tax=Leptospira ryugenii TaxID=1917863 RepID=A0A2P2E0T8_9LEPT|nr:twin-arginine translocase TatA/TatE family subunit [Leptospira ryugenii]GBF50482.1 Sec-independent protein secretion pathway translocase [Leptospira ryugenii]